MNDFHKFVVAWTVSWSSDRFDFSFLLLFRLFMRGFYGLFTNQAAVCEVL